MMNAFCPICKEPLMQEQLQNGGFYFRCIKGHGVSLAVTMFLPLLTEMQRQAWQPILRLELKQQKPDGAIDSVLCCPFCQKKMHRIFPGKDQELACAYCERIWVYASNWPSFLAHDVAPRTTEAFSKENSDYSDGSAIAGIPLIAGEGLEGSGFPVGAFCLMFLCTICYLVTHHHPVLLQRYYTFNAQAPLQHSGINLLASIFAHAGSSHIVGNMFYLFGYGSFLEALIGADILIYTFLFAGLAGNLCMYLFVPESYSLGASGGIAGLIFCLSVIRPKARIKFSFLSRGKISNFYLALWFFSLLWIFSELQPVFLQSQDGIGHFAHIGGALAGLLAGFFFRSAGMVKKAPIK